jgi:AraC family transcriptional regulator of adaptative response/methylated-DNA-[protein]-cysteine methyltransferase
MACAAPTTCLYYIVRDTPLGAALAACSEQGIRYLSFLDIVRNPEAILRQEFSSESIIAAHSATSPHALNLLAAAIQGACSAPAETYEPLLDPHGTPFQRSVWRYLESIPPGETRSYQAVARAIGRPSASRAVARACASNRIAVLIPCHRVVCSDGSVSGYRWGVERKRYLLRREAVFKDKKTASEVTPEGRSIAREPLDTINSAYAATAIES